MGIHIFPNPSNGILNLNLDDDLIYTLNIMDILGKKVFTTIVTDKNNKIDLNHLKKGVYMLELKNNTSHYSKEIIIE